MRSYYSGPRYFRHLVKGSLAVMGVWFVVCLLWQFGQWLGGLF